MIRLFLNQIEINYFFLVLILIKVFQHNNNGDIAKLNKLRSTNPSKILIGQLNINSIRHKFDMLADIISGKIDIFLITETKIDESFPTNQFTVPGYTPPFRRDRTVNGGGLLLYIREDIPSKLLTSFECEDDFETILVEINLHKVKWLIGVCYSPHKRNASYFFTKLSASLNSYLIHYENVLFMGDFNIEPDDDVIKEFCTSYNLKNVLNEPTCYKNINNPSCIDLMLTNKYRSFKKSMALETGLSDFHKLTVTVLNTSYKKGKAKIILYRDYKKYSNLSLRNDLATSFTWEELKMMSNDQFTSIFMEILDKHAPVKQKYIRANQNPFITKELRKAFMKRSQLKNKYYKVKTQSSKLAYKKHRNFCKNLLTKSKKKYYNNLKPNCISDGKKFWNSVKPLFSDKVINNVNITLVENDVIIKEFVEIAEEFNHFFSSAVANLSIEDNFPASTNSENSNPVLNAIERYKGHPSILKINETFPNNTIITFNKVDLDAVSEIIQTLDNSKAAPTDSIPVRILKDNIDLFSNKLQTDVNRSLANLHFPNNLKLADISPTHKKGSRSDKSNYRPVSILPPVSKIFERMLYHQINESIADKLSPYLCGFRKNYNTQNCILSMIEKWRTSLDKKGSAGAVLTDLSKAFDCLNHELLIAKMHSYGFDYDALKLVYSYLSCRYQRVRINSHYSTLSGIISGVPQGSILGPLLFNIYINGIFLFLTNSNMSNYADDNTPYACENNIENVLNQLQNDSDILMNYFKNNYFKGNPDKFHMLLSCSNNDLSINVDNYTIVNSNCVKLLGIKIDSKLKFDAHVEGICKKASQKLHALGRVSKYMSFKQRRIIMKSFINSQFGYCPLVWMFHSRTLNHRINRIHERGLRIVYDDYNSTFDELLLKEGSVTIHERNIQALAIELFKVYKGIAPKIMEEIFQLKSKHIYESRFQFTSRNVRTSHFGTETLMHLGPKIWFIIPNNLKEINTLLEFKKKIKDWRPVNCPCKLCIPYIQGLGFTIIK